MIITKTFEAPPIDETEVLRYAGYKIMGNVHTESGSKSSVACQAIDAETRALLDACLKELQGKLEYKVCYRELSVTLDGDVCDFGLFQVASRHLAQHLENTISGSLEATSKSGRAIVFAATLGVGIDRLITKYSSLSPAKALMFQAIGAERIEALCDAFCEDVKLQYASNGADMPVDAYEQVQKNRKNPRFSPGYGDLPLETQRDIFAVLGCEKKIGLTLNGSLLMSPSKSVTAFVGIGTPV